LRQAPSLTSLEGGSGTCQAKIEASGIPAQGVEIEARLTGKALRLTPAGSGGKSVAIEEIHAKTRWTHTPRSEAFDNISIRVNKVSLAGRAELGHQQDTPHLTAEFSSPDVPLESLLGLYPAPSFFPESPESKPQGNLQINSLTYDGPLSAQLPDMLAGISGRMTFAQGQLPLPGTDGIRDLSFEINLAGNQLDLKKGFLSCLDIPWQFQGTIKNPFTGARNLHFEADTPLPAEKLMKLPALSAGKKLILEGSAPMKFRMQGDGQKLWLSLEGDLSPLSVASGDLVFKDSTESARLEATASTDLKTWTLEKAHLTSGLIQAEGQGHGNLGANPDYEIQLNLGDLDLEKIPRTGKLLQRLQPQGKISFTQNWQGGRGQVPLSRGVLTLKGAGVHLTSILADLKGINGTIDFTPDQAEFSNIMARLGTSPIMVSGTLGGTPDPILHLSVKSPRIRADELIFPSDQSYLYDLDGALTIDKNQIRFDEVHTVLEKGTVATVKGYVTLTQNPETRLWISSKNAVIDEVIDLWGKTGKEKKRPEKKDGKGTLLIDVEAEKGVIDRFHFQNARGQIRLKDNILVIHPLDFHSGPGYGNGQVLVVTAPDKPSLLKISGHVENFDAEDVSNELIRYGGLVSGTLRGDFYLEGRIGKTYLPTSRGEFNVEIQKGVLKKFNALSKVFSILNVSQIFALKLPDMATEGMPFNRATGTVQMRKGLLTSENIWVDSDAMNLSLVGNMNLVEKKVDAVLGVKPLGTVDKIITHIPLAGWILAGEDKALVTAYFEVKGKVGNPQVKAIPMASISKKAQGIFKRIFKLPEKMITETGEIFRGEKPPEKKQP